MNKNRDFIPFIQQRKKNAGEEETLGVVRQDKRARHSRARKQMSVHGFLRHGVVASCAAPALKYLPPLIFLRAASVVARRGAMLSHRGQS